MNSKMKQQSYEVPVVIPSTEAGKFETVHVTLQKLPDSKTQAKLAYRLVVVDGTMYFINHQYVVDAVKPSSEWIDTDLVIYTNFLGISNSRRELEDKNDPFEDERFKINTTTVARVLKAVHLFGFLTRDQYRAADRERGRLAIEAFAAERAVAAEDDLQHLLSNGLTLQRAKKLIDGQIKQEKQAQKVADAAAKDAAKREPGFDYTIAS